MDTITNATAPATLEYRNYRYTITLQNDADGEAYPLYTVCGNTYISLRQMKSAIDHLINQAKLGRRNEESLI